MSVSTSAPTTRSESSDRARSALVLLAFLVGSTAVIMAGTAIAQPHYGWYTDAVKAPWDISPWLRASLWMLFHIGMSVAAWLVWLERRHARVSSPLSLYGSQLLLHAVWRPALFVFYPLIGRPALWLAGAIMLLMAVTVAVAFVEFRRVNRWAGMLVIPYLSWILYILTLNVGLIALN